MIYIDLLNYDECTEPRRAPLIVYCKDGREYKADAFEVKDGIVYLYRDLMECQNKIEKILRFRRKYVSVFVCALTLTDIKFITLTDGQPQPQQPKKS
jgi:hypothetical protein